MGGRINALSFYRHYTCWIKYYASAWEKSITIWPDVLSKTVFFYDCAPCLLNIKAESQSINITRETKNPSEAR